MIYSLQSGTDHAAWPKSAGFHPTNLEGWQQWLDFTRFDEVAAEVGGRMLIHGAAGWRDGNITAGYNVNCDPVLCEVHHFASLAQDPRVGGYPHLWKEWYNTFAPRAQHYHNVMIAHVGACGMDETPAEVDQALAPIRQAGAIPSLDSAGEVVTGGENIQASLVGVIQWCIEAAPIESIQCRGYSYSLSDQSRSAVLPPAAGHGHGAVPPVEGEPDEPTPPSNAEQRIVYMPGYNDPAERMGKAVEWLERGRWPALYILPDTGKPWGEGMNFSKAQVRKLVHW